MQRKSKIIEWERLKISSRILEIPREDFMQIGLNKGQKWYGPNRSRRYLRRGDKNTQKNYRKKIFTTQKITKVCSLTLT